jgi:predicted ATPase
MLKKHSEDGWNKKVARYVYSAISNWTVFHVHDTSGTAAMRRSGTVRDTEKLLPDAGNLAAFLYMLREEEKETYDLIVETIRLVTPFFKDFRLHPRQSRDDQVIRLEWMQQGSNYPFLASQLSDGTLRFIALATALLQPYPPATILIDEPELGLHPYALEILGNLILQAESRAQVIISTQSAQLLNAFTPGQIIIVDRKHGESTFTRLDEEQLKEWLDDYSIGELWQKNVYGGGPAHE